MRYMMYMNSVQLYESVVVVLFFIYYDFTALAFALCHVGAT